MRRSTLSGLFGFFALLLALTADRHLVAAPALRQFQQLIDHFIQLRHVAASAGKAHRQGDRHVELLGCFASLRQNAETLVHDLLENPLV